MTFWLVYAAILIGFFFAQRADARVSEEGFKMGYVEGDELVAKLFGNNPSSFHLQFFNISQLGVWTLPGILMGHYAGMACFKGWAIAIPLAASGRHLLAVRKWRRAFATNGASLYQDGQTAWQKFLGLSRSRLSSLPCWCCLP